MTITHLMPSHISFVEDHRDWAPGDEIAYRVRYLNKDIGVVERDWLRTVDDEVRAVGWRFFGPGNRKGSGRTRKEAVLNAYTDPLDR